MVQLFPPTQRIGVFRGFTEGGLEFHADLVIPYRPTLQNVPMHGQFVLVQLENESEAVLGRITSVSATGRLTSDSGEQYSVRAAMEDRAIDDDLREAFLKYKVDIRVLGVIRIDGEQFTFIASHRRMPHVGSPVAFPAPEVLRHITGHYDQGAEVGFYALGEYIYAGGDDRLETLPWMQRRTPDITVKFPISNLVSRRSVIFARAGYGKSNLNKLLFSTLYSGRPVVRKRGEREVPVGTIIFDPDGEYFWPDDKGRPGFCDVEALQDQVVVFTSREAPSPFYGSFVAGSVRLDIRRLQPADVISIALSPEKQDQQHVRKLRQMNPGDWSELVDLIDTQGNSADLGRIRELLRLESGQDMEALAARGNMTSIVRTLHDRNSQLMDLLIRALRDGKLCIVDVSQLRGGPSLVLSGLILRRIFDRNQEEFTKAEPRTIPTIAVVEEAQSVLNERASAAQPYIEWVKEGRKYDLGAVLITQQPGSIPVEILSQVDNWFLFHLLSEHDLKTAKAANAHFSSDLLASLLNEPIEGQGLFWSSAGKTKYPIPLRVMSFERLHPVADPRNNRGAVPTYASQMRAEFGRAFGVAPTPPPGLSTGSVEKAQGLESDTDGDSESNELDMLGALESGAIAALRGDGVIKTTSGFAIPWGVVLGHLRNKLPAQLDGRDEIAYRLVARAVTEIVGGAQDEAWHTERRGSKSTTFIVVN